MSLHPKPDLTHGPIQDCSNGKDEHGFDMVPDHPLAMTTDTIPEAKSLIFAIKNGSIKGQENLEQMVADVCLAYHQRRLAECGGDAGKLLFELMGHYTEKHLELLQLHTAKAVEEATAKLHEEMEEGHNAIFKCATLQKQCESLQQENRVLNDKYLEITETRTQLEQAFDRAQKQCEELRYSLKETEELSAHHLKERDDLRTQCDKIKLRPKYLTNEVEDLRTRAEKAEDEVEELQAMISVLQQDVRPLVSLLQQATKFTKSKPDYWASCSQCEHHKDDATEALETFLTKHPNFARLTGTTDPEADSSGKAKGTAEE